MSTEKKFDAKDPYAGFRFKAILDGTGGVAGVSEISGIKSKTAVKAMREGGNNIYERWLIEPHSYPEMLTLKKVFFEDSNDLYMWVVNMHTGMSASSSNQRRKTVSVQLQSQEGATVGTYVFYNCIPAEFEGPSFNAKGGEISVEAIKIRFDYFEYKPGSGA